MVFKVVPLNVYDSRDLTTENFAITNSNETPAMKHVVVLRKITHAELCSIRYLSTFTRSLIFLHAVHASGAICSKFCRGFHKNLLYFTSILKAFIIIGNL